VELGNPPALPLPRERMAEATGERAKRGRSLRSSPRAGKPSTWRRQAVDTLCKQGMDHVSDTVNTGFILDMQRKLYRWSAADPDKRFADLFNIVCDRGTLLHAWQRLARNRGSNAPGTDRVTRKAVEERPDGVAGFLEDIRQELRQGTYRPQPVRQRLIPKPGKPGKFRPLGIPTLKDRLVQMALSSCWSRFSRRISIRSRTAFGPAEAPMTLSQGCVIS
jgi:retron-type reverse transcriptase